MGGQGIIIIITANLDYLFYYRHFDQNLQVSVEFYETLFLFYKLGNPGSERLCNLPNIAKLLSDEYETRTPIYLTLKTIFIALIYTASQSNGLWLLQLSLASNKTQTLIQVLKDQ